MRVQPFLTDFPGGGSWLLYRKGHIYAGKYESKKQVFGHTAGIDFRKQTGNFIFNTIYGEESNTFDPNDLGFNTVNNKRIFNQRFAYRIFKPFWKLSILDPIISKLEKLWLKVCYWVQFLQILKLHTTWLKSKLKKCKDVMKLGSENFYPCRVKHQTNALYANRIHLNRLFN